MTSTPTPGFVEGVLRLKSACWSLVAAVAASFGARRTADQAEFRAACRDAEADAARSDR